MTWRLRVTTLASGRGAAQPRDTRSRPRTEGGISMEGILTIVVVVLVVLFVLGYFGRGRFRA
jgi:hypothetical protein